MIASIHKPGLPGGFFRLIGDPKRYEKQMSRMNGGRPQEVDDIGFVAVKDYVQRTIQGSEGKPYCPFVKGIYLANSYVVHQYNTRAKNVNFGSIFEGLRSAFRLLPPYEKTKTESKTDLTVVIGAFCGPDCESPQFHFKLEKAHAKVKEDVREQGLMIGIMGPHHQLGGREGGSEPMFVCDVPIVAFRRMHASDEVFMASERSKNSYGQYFELTQSAT